MNTEYTTTTLLLSQILLHIGAIIRTIGRHIVCTLEPQRYIHF